VSYHSCGRRLGVTLGGFLGGDMEVVVYWRGKGGLREWGDERRDMV